MLFPSPSPGPNWEALQEPEPSSDDELDTEDGEVNTHGLAHLNTQRVRDGRPEATRNPPVSAPPAFASTSTNLIIGDNSRSQMKRKESESLFTSKKRVRYFPAAHSDQDDVIDLDLDEHAEYKRHTGINSKPAEQKTMGGLRGWQPGTSLSVSSTTTNRKFGNDSSPPVHAKLNLMRKSSGRRPPPFFYKRLSESAVAESIRPATRDPPSKLAGLPFDAYKRAESRTVPASDPGRSVVSASPVRENPFGKNPSRAPLKRRQLPSAPQTTRYLSKSKAIPSDAEVIEISDDDDSPPASISLAKSKSKSTKPPFETLSAPAQVRQGSRTAKTASGSAFSSATKKFLPKAPVEVIEILDSDDEQLLSKAQPREKIVGRSSSGRLSEHLQESATGSNTRRDQSRHVSSVGGDNFEGSDRYDDMMDIDGGDPLKIPSSSRALSQELQVTDDTNDNQGIQGSIPLPSSSPSSVGLSPKDNYLSTPSASTSPIASLTMSSPPQQFFTLPRPNSAKKSINASPSIGTSTGSSSNRLGFSPVAVPSSLQPPPPADKHRRQFARKMAPRSVSDEDVGASSSEPKETANTKANKGKEKEIRESPSSSSGTESINMRGLQDALSMGSDTLKQRLVSPTLPKKQVQTLAEVIISAGQLNSTKKTKRRLQRNTKVVPVDQTSDVEASTKDGQTADEKEKELKAAIGSSRLLVNLLPALKGKSSVSAAAKVTESPAPSPQGKKLSLSPTRTQDSHAKLVPPKSPIKVEGSSYPLSTPSPNPNIMTHDVPSQKPLSSLEMKLKTESSVGKIFGAAAQPKTEPTTAFEFKSGIAVIEPPETADLEAIPTSNSPPLSIHPPASSIVPTSSNDAAVKDWSFDTLGQPSNSPDGDEEECQALLQGPNNVDVIPSHEVQSSLQDSIVVRHESHINLDTSVAAPSPLTSLSATTEVLNEHTSVSPPIPEVPTRRSSRLSSSHHSSNRSSRPSSNRSSGSPSSGGLGTAFDFDFGPSNSVPVSRISTPEVQDPSALPSPAKTYGGFRALTWKDFRKDLNNFTPKTYYAKDLPHELQDHINSMSEYTQMMEGMRDFFKATILENTVEDEPDAPPIDIWNSVDTQSTPPWEFYYTNNMWLGEGVPPPDIKSLISCTCKGGCNPRSKTCACLLRQKEATGIPLLEFAYDKSGKLRIPGYPIFECNDLCGCSDECQNRVVQQGRKVSVNIGKTETKGWGVFAGSKKIPDGTFIGIYSGELLTDAVAHERGIKYNKSGRTYLFDLDFHHLKEGNPNWENFFTVDAYHAGNFTRFLNHSCDPNCRLYACYINEGNIQKPLLAIFTRREIEPFEEICFNYQGLYDDGDDSDSDESDDDKILDPDHGKDMIYVRCRCGAKNCTGTMFK